MEPVVNFNRAKSDIVSSSISGISNLRKLLVITFFSTISFLLMSYFEIPLLPAFPVFKYDASEVPALIVGFAVGTWPGIYVVFFKTLMYLLVSGKGFTTFGLGPFMAFIAGATLVFVSTKVYFLNPTKKGALTGMILGTFAMTLIMLPLNYLFFGILPLIFPNMETLLYDNAIYYLLAGVLPFNLIKGIITSSFAFILYKKISPFLRDTAARFRE